MLVGPLRGAIVCWGSALTRVKKCGGAAVVVAAVEDVVVERERERERERDPVQVASTSPC